MEGHIDELLTAQELAARLKIKLATVRFWQSREGLPCLRVGRLPRYEFPRIREWLEARADQRKARQPEGAKP